MNIAKTFMAGLLSLGMLVLFGGYAAAGPDITIEVEQSNSSEVINVGLNGSSTGGNDISAEEDVEGGEITTGDADADVNFENDGNSNEAELNLDDDSEGEVEVENSNSALVVNGTENLADTGDNTIDSDEEDVEGGIIDTGNADADVNFDNAVNGNNTDLDISGSDDLDAEIEQENDAEIVNLAGNLAGTGDNLIESDDEDVEGGEITTGDADATVNVSNHGSFINSNSATVDASDSDDLDLDVEHGNELGILNGILNGGTTGSNEIDADEDVEGGTIDTGDANADVTVETEGNSNEADLDLSGSDDVEGEVEQGNDGGVANLLGNFADTGSNLIEADDDEVEDGEITTGDADASKDVVTRLNRNVVRFR